jgi:DAK2 domain fusion protein YloV
MTTNVAVVVAAAHAALKAQVARIDALNVYPVPDGDTGTNMLLTLDSMLKETSGSTYEEPGAASRAVARAALMGARGNSGVILSQMVRGACDVLARHGRLTAGAFAAALEGATERAYASVRQPVEGTMLTVIKDAARAAREALTEDADLPAVMRASARAAHDSVRRTPELLDVLREAGVVDAGGLGVAVILDGLYAWASGEEIPEPTDEEGGTPDLDAIHAQEEAWGYCTEFLVTGFSGDEHEFEEHIHSSGRSVLVVPDEDVVKVHLHTQDPGEALSYAGTFGRLSGVKIDDMEAQIRSRDETEEEPAKVGVVAASRGEGSRKLFESMGAVVIEGGQGANPSAADFARAVEKTGAKAVILLPNNKNIVPTAEQVGELVDAEIHIVPTLSIAGGLAAMVGFDPEGEAEEVAEEMREITACLRCAEVTQAVREASIGGREVPEGSYIGLLDGELVAVEQGVEDAAIRLVEKMLEEGVDIVTLLRGYGMDERSARRVAERIMLLDEDVNVEIKNGGQPMYPLQMVAE